MLQILDYLPFYSSLMKTYAESVMNGSGQKCDQVSGMAECSLDSRVHLCGWFHQWMEEGIVDMENESEILAMILCFK